MGHPVAARITYLGIIGVINQRQSFLFLCDSTLIQEVALICTLDNSHSMHLTIYTTLDQLDQEQYAVCLYWLLVYWSQNWLGNTLRFLPKSLQNGSRSPRIVYKMFNF